MVSLVLMQVCRDRVMLVYGSLTPGGIWYQVFGLYCSIKWNKLYMWDRLQAFHQLAFTTCWKPIRFVEIYWNSLKSFEQRFPNTAILKYLVFHSENSSCWLRSSESWSQHVLKVIRFEKHCFWWMWVLQLSFNSAGVVLLFPNYPKICNSVSSSDTQNQAILWIFSWTDGGEFWQALTIFAFLESVCKEECSLSLGIRPS